MDLGRGVLTSLEKEVAQNGNAWIPSTPDKPVMQNSSNSQSEVSLNQMGDQNWDELTDLYGEFLRNKQPLKFDFTGTLGVTSREHDNQGVAPVESDNVQQQNLSQTGILGLNLQNRQDAAPDEAYNMLPTNFSLNGCSSEKGVMDNTRVVDILKKIGSLNQNGERMGSCVQKLGETVPPHTVSSSSELLPHKVISLDEKIPPQKVNSLAELMRSATCDPSLSISPNRNTHFVGESTVVCPLQQGEKDNMAYTSVGSGFQQTHILHKSNQVASAMSGAELPQSDILHVRHDFGRYNLQNMPNACNSNLSLAPRPDAGECSSAVRPVPLAPETPEQSKIHQINRVPPLLIEEASTQEKHMQDDVVLSQQHEILMRDHSENVLDSLGASTAAVSISPKERNNCDGGNGVIDLNKTPQQKTPKRRKHRPKVVVEGKRKRSPKSAAGKNITPDGNPPEKRKYVRKNGTTNSTPPSTDTVKVVEKSNVRTATKSCKRKLNFDLDNAADKERQGRGLDNKERNNEGSKLPFDLNLDLHIDESFTELNGSSTSVMKAGQQTSVSSFNLGPHESIQQVATILPPSSRDQTLNIIAQNLSVRNGSGNQCTDDGKYNQVHHHISQGLDDLSFQAKSSEPNVDSSTHSSVQTMPHVLGGSVDSMQQCGTTREYAPCAIRNQHTISPIGSQVWPCGVSTAGHLDGGSNSLWQHCLEMHKKENYEEKVDGTSPRVHSGFTTVADFVQQIKSNMNKKVHPHSESTNSECRGETIFGNSVNTSTMATCACYMNYPGFMHNFQQQHVLSQVHPYSERMAPKSSHISPYVQNTRYIPAVTNWNLESSFSSGHKLIPVEENISSPVFVAAKSPTARRITSKKVPNLDRVLQQSPMNKKSNGHSSNKVQGIQENNRNLISVDDITNCMKYLQLTESGKEIIWKGQTALVPYRGDGAVVTYEEFDPVKKRRPRPKVDLDPETNRLWNLLMSNEGGESAETMNADKEKWWEEERKIFRGRVDSFIARMHLVQGDRRFSKWKGSVVDSVIGVFLTQNVSDHLSSSAFMSLAAKFPIKSTTAEHPCCEIGGNPTIVQHEVRIMYPDGSTSHQKMVKEPVSRYSSVISRETSECREVIQEKSTSPVGDNTWRTEVDIISSQSSSESLNLQASEDIRSSSGSNSDAEWNISNILGHASVSGKGERNAAFQQRQFHFRGNSSPNKGPLIRHQRSEKAAYEPSPSQAGISTTNPYSFISEVQHCQSPNMSKGMQNCETDALACLREKSTSTFASKDPDIINLTGVECMHDCVGQSSEIILSVSQDGRPKFQPSSVNHVVQDKCHGLQTTSLDESCRRNGQHFNQQQIVADNSKHVEVETGTELGNSEKPSSKISATTSTARKRKAEKEQAESFNWDTLRKQVQSMTGTIERSREAMDSIDYEAVRNADVREISDAIKERGMNNKLAERMKDFLDRLVEDHERTDLEWLRDIEPDKAKDYLLSIRGIGLKSVECVRLLTLHHLAFPVDTNVGRIAVRLGWVPLQPLPEALQLHLLELYPVLETIQKYLWPRLCKLDQETLYELHYQMITFGKVFCTKRDPNCNACPMRGECRHFASAFASARLALPWPQERHIVSSTAPIYANKSSDVMIKPMPLPSPEDDTEQEKGLTINCEPVIEEPTTPEAPVVEERDIEDAFYEDPDEIPIIKLDLQEFTTNLQCFMQQQIDIGGGDMSKALVALSPQVASIPIPKLKNISRLRTEHQVYELPDSHPLLEGMDRREPDDPSPYLLAIWTPGETADSVQPPESKCSSAEGGGMCNKSTCFSCNSTKEAQAQTVRGTILIPCRTAMRGSFPLNGTYFQVNEVFADHESSLNPIDVPRSFLWNLPRRTVFFGTSVTSIFKGMTTEGIQFCFWKGFVCVRGFDQKSRAPRPLKARFHFIASKMAKQNE